MLLHDVERFLIASRQAGRSEATITQYGWHLRRLVAWLADRAPSRDLLREWGAGLRDAWLPATCKQAVSAARSFFRWCHEEGLVGEDLGLALKIPKVPARVQRVITLNEASAMLAACNPGTIKGIRDRALIDTLIDTGLRASEICRVRLADVDMTRGLMLVTIKGGSQDLAYFGDSAAVALDAWISVRVAAPGVGALFVSVGGGTPGHQLTTRGLRIILRRLGEKAGVEGVSPHAFRRGFACIATQAGAPSRVVQLAGRWADIRMVERYTASLRRGGLHQRWSPADFVNGNGVDP
jgi:site-specific recombinase XerD